MMTCTHCHAPIRLLRTTRGMLIQYDSTPHPGGQWVIDTHQIGEEQRSFGRRALDRVDGDKPRYTRHACRKVST